MLIQRRKFLQGGALATAGLMVPKFLKAFEYNASNALPAGNKAVIIIQLSGGNDGLNTIIPYRNDLYYKNRPGIGIAKEKALSLTDEVGIHPALSYFKTLHDNGELAILNNVGYPNPDRSHFRSMDIWQTASNSNEFLNTGWIGRYLDAQCNGCPHPTQALEIDDILSLALKGEHQKAIAFKDAGRLYRSSHEDFFKNISLQHHDTNHEQPADYLYKTLADTLSSAEYIYQESRAKASDALYPKSDIGNNLKTIASLICSGINTKVYYLSLGSFDTHVFQETKQQVLFKQLNDAVEAFTNDLKTNHCFDDVLIFTFSEFGRRVAQNASGGTDHGTANNMFFISGGLKQKGILNELPDLSDLEEGDLKYKIDFKDVYATILNKWLDADDILVLKGQRNYMKFI